MAIVTIQDDRLVLQAPYHPDLALHARALGGHWKGTETGWSFAADRETELRQACLTLWGVDGRPEMLDDLVDLRIEVCETDTRYPLWNRFRENIWLCGRELVACPRGRQVARAGRGVKFIKGQPDYLTQGLKWWLVVENGAELLVQGVPRAAVDRYLAALAGHGVASISRPADRQARRQKRPN